jgi:hypothetical protein
MIKCRECLYWVSINSSGGTCHRHAPRPAIVKRGSFGVDGTRKDLQVILPTTTSEDWCGEGDKKLVTTARTRKTANA